VLFKQKKGVAEVVVDIRDDRLDIVGDAELKRALQLTTEDLRFVDAVTRSASAETADAFLDGVGWEGGDEWVRAQFRLYLICLLRTVGLAEVGEESGKNEAAAHFGQSFVDVWRRTGNFARWKHFLTTSEGQRAKDILLALEPSHPKGGQTNIVADTRLHFSNAMGGTEGGKRVTQAVTSTGRAVAGGITSARGAFSSFLTSIGKATSGGGKGSRETSRSPSPRPKKCQEDGEVD